MINLRVAEAHDLGKDGNVGEEEKRYGGTAFIRCFASISFLRASLLSRETVHSGD